VLRNGKFIDQLNNSHPLNKEPVSEAKQDLADQGLRRNSSSMYSQETKLQQLL